MSWFVVGTPAVTATNPNSVFWFPVRGTSHNAVQARYPNSLVVFLVFKTKAAAQAYADKSNAVTSGGSGSGSPNPPSKKSKGKNQQKGKVRGAIIVAIARKWLGVPYLFGGTTRQGVDCSGLVLNVAQEAGIKGCPRTSEEQWAWCEHITQSEAGPGDLVFFVGAPEETGAPGHVGIIVAPGTMINAPFPGTVVRIDHYNPGPPVQNTSNPNNLWGYGRMRGAVGSVSANPHEGGRVGSVAPAAAGSAISASVGSVIVALIAGVILFALFLLLLGSGLLWKGSH